MTRRAFHIALAFVAIALLASASSADYIYTIEEWSADTGTNTNKVAVDKNLLKMSLFQGDSETPANDMIFRGDRNEAVIVDHGRKSYMVMDEETVQELGAQVSGAMAEVNKALEGLPEDQRRMMEKMMKERMPKAALGGSRKQTEARRTSDRATKGGLPAVRYEILTDGQKTQDIWIADWSKVDGGNEVSAVFKQMSTFFDSLMEAVSSAAGAMGGMPFADSPFSSLEELGGFPVATVSYDEDGEIERRSELKSVVRADLDASDFEPKEGYREQQMMAGR